MASKLGRYLAPLALAGSLTVGCTSNSVIQEIQEYPYRDMIVELEENHNGNITKIELYTRNLDGSRNIFLSAFDHDYPVKRDGIFDEISDHSLHATLSWNTGYVKGSEYDRFLTRGLIVATPQEARERETLVNEAYQARPNK